MILTPSTPMFTSHPGVIRLWSAEILRDGLFRGDGIAQFGFRGDGVIHAIVYLPGVAWVMWADHPARWQNLPPRFQAFTRPDMRRRGIMNRLWEFHKGVYHAGVH